MNLDHIVPGLLPNPLSQPVNTVQAGPASGSAAPATYRALVAADIPAIAESGVTSLTTDLALKAPLTSPALTGTPTAPTAAGGTNTTQLATTAFVTSATSTLATDSAVVHIAGTEMITGQKNFSNNGAGLSFGPAARASVVNTTVAVVGSQYQVSPGLRLEAHCWDSTNAADAKLESQFYIFPNAGASPFASVIIQNSLNSGGWKYSAQFDSNGAVSFFDAASNTTRMRFDSTGANSDISITLGSGGTSHSIRFLSSASALIGSFQTNSTTLNFISNSGDIRFASNGTNEVFYADSSGNAGTGTTSPASRWDIYGGTLTYSNITSTTKQTQGDVVPSWVVSTFASRKARIVHEVYDTAAREAIRLEATGSAARVGIGGAVDTNELFNVNGCTKATRFAGSSGTPTVAAGLGAGVNATVSAAGTDAAGSITINTSALDTPAGNSTIVTLTFNTTYTSAPYVSITPANDAAYGLAFGVFRCRQGDVTTTTFTIRSGTTPLTALTAATYIINYEAMQ